MTTNQKAGSSSPSGRASETHTGTGVPVACGVPQSRWQSVGSHSRSAHDRGLNLPCISDGSPIAARRVRPLPCPCAPRRSLGWAIAVHSWMAKADCRPGSPDVARVLAAPLQRPGEHASATGSPRRRSVYRPTRTGCRKEVDWILWCNGRYAERGAAPADYPLGSCYGYWGVSFLRHRSDVKIWAFDTDMCLGEHVTELLKEKIDRLVLGAVSASPTSLYDLISYLSEVGVPPDVGDEVIWQLVMADELVIDDGFLHLSPTSSFVLSA